MRVLTCRLPNNGRVLSAVAAGKKLYSCSVSRASSSLTLSSLQHMLTTQRNNSSTSTSTSTTSTNTTTNNNTIPNYISGTTTHFGFRNVPIDEKESEVRNVFENVAESYDVMNDLMSGGLHRLWKDELIDMTGVKPMAKALRKQGIQDKVSDQPGNLMSILDVAGGTGDVAFRFLEAASCPERSKSSGTDEISITVCDINNEMLRVGERRARTKYGDDLLDRTQSLSFVQGNAQELKDFEDDSFDIYTIAFGLRNVTDVDAALREAYRVLKPGGRYLCLEFSKVTNPTFASIYDTYSFHAIPKIGEMVANDRDSYQYLVESIRQFCTQEELLHRVEKAGFESCRYTNMTGGIVAVHEGWKPLYL